MHGAGKTTLIGIVCGIVTATDGMVMVDGHDIARDYRAARSLIGPCAPGIDDRCIRNGVGDSNFSRGLWGKPPDPDRIAKILKSLSLWERRERAKFLHCPAG